MVTKFKNGDTVEAQLKNVALYFTDDRKPVYKAEVIEVTDETCIIGNGMGFRKSFLKKSRSKKK